jgi:Uma2 family endonuclease
LGETDLHRRIIIDLIGTLELRYAGQQVYVSGDLLLFYEPGNRRRHVCPDVLVTKGLVQADRLNYILWEEKLPPNAVFEITSKTTRKEDVEGKFAVYRDKIGVAEYFLFDPLGEYLEPSLQGYRLRAGEYLAIRPTRGRLVCKQLGVELEVQDQSLRLFDQQTGQPLLCPRELAEAAQERAEAAQERAERAEEEVARLKQELSRLRKQ